MKNLFTIISLFLFAQGTLSAQTFFDAVNHAFSLAATGGFSTRNLSVGYYDSDLINLVVMIFMAVCAMHFGLVYAVFVTRSFKPMNNTVVKYYFGSIAVCSIIVAFSLMSEGGYSHWGRALMDSSFSQASIAAFAVSRIAASCACSAVL